MKRRQHRHGAGLLSKQLIGVSAGFRTPTDLILMSYPEDRSSINITWTTPLIHITIVFIIVVLVNKAVIFILAFLMW